MDRRGFLGSLIGSVVSLDFFARLESAEWQRVISPYRVVFKANGHYIQAPGVVTKLENDAAIFNTEKLLASTDLNIESFSLLTDKGEVIGSRPMILTLKEGNSLTLNYSIKSHGVQLRSVEDHVKLKLHAKKGNWQMNPKEISQAVVLYN